MKGVSISQVLLITMGINSPVGLQPHNLLGMADNLDN